MDTLVNMLAHVNDPYARDFIAQVQSSLEYVKFKDYDNSLRLADKAKSTLTWLYNAGRITGEEWTAIMTETVRLGLVCPR